MDSTADLGDVEGTAKCFDSSINRHLLVPGPPRSVVPETEMHKALSRWAEHLRALLSLCRSMGRQNTIAVDSPEAEAVALVSRQRLAGKRSLPELISFQGQLPVGRRNEPNVLPRSVGQMSLPTELAVQKLTKESLAYFLFPVEEAERHLPDEVEEFVVRSTQLLCHVLRLTNTNRARRFRRLAHVFPEFNSLQHDAWSLDLALRATFGANLRFPRPAWVWVVENALRQMIAKLMLGVSLELYDTFEMHMIYWYADYLYGLRIYNLQDVCYHKEQIQTAQGTGTKKQGARAGKGGYAAGKQQNGKGKPKCPPPSLLMLQACQCVLRGLFRVFMYMQDRKLIRVPVAVAGGMPRRFSLRFKSLEQFKLPYRLSYADFQDLAENDRSFGESLQILAAAQDCFEEAKELVDRVHAGKMNKGPADPLGEEAGAEVVRSEDLTDLKKVVVANSLAIAQLRKHSQPGESEKLSVEITHVYHPFFASVQVVKASAQKSV